MVKDVTYRDVDGHNLKMVSTESIEEGGWGFDGNRNVYYIDKIGTVNAYMICHKKGFANGSYEPLTVRCYQEDELSYIMDNCTRIGDEDNSIEGINGVKGLKIYPNPLSKDNILFIENYSDIPILSVSMCDITGRKSESLIWEEDKDRNNSINLNFLPQGLYLLNVEFTDKTKVTYKIIKY